MFKKKIISIKKEFQKNREDLIDLKICKEDLNDLEAYIKELSSFLPLAVCTINPLKIIVDINQAFRNLSGYSSIEIVGEFLKKIFSEEEKIENFLDEVQEKRIIKYKELILISKEKKEIPVRLSASIRKDQNGSFIGYFIGLIDITEIKKSQKKIEEKIKDLEKSRVALINILEDVGEARKIAEEERDKTQTIIYNFSDGLLFFDNEKILRIFNPEAEIYFEVKAKNIVSKEISFLKKFNKLKILIDFLNNRPERIFREELKIEENLILDITSLPVSTEDRGKIGTLIILHDVTREKRIEKSKSEFVSITAHQLRTPLSAMKWTFRMLLDGDLGKITLEQKEFVEKAYKSNERVIKIVDDLLNVTRIEEGRYLYNLSLARIEDIVEEVIISNKELAEKKGVKLEFQKPEQDLFYIKVDIEKIKLAIQNLIENAIHYTSKNGRVTVSLKYTKKETEFKVQDTGIGISKDQQYRLFTKFFRAPNAIKKETDGSGLGLFITKNIIEAHQGKIGFKSEENKGSTFWFILPIQKSA